MTDPHDFGIFKRIAQNLLKNTLESFLGTKDLIIEDSLMKPLDRIAGATLLRQHGVDKIFKLDSNRTVPGPNELQVFLLRPTLPNAKLVAESARRHGRKKFGVIFCPRKTVLCDSVFEANGVYGDIQVEQFNPDLIPIEADLFSLEQPDVFHQTFVEGTFDGLQPIAYSLWNLQNLFGTIPHVFAIGTAAHQCLKLVDTLCWEHGELKMSGDFAISHLFVVDRDVDFASIFLSCLTFEALVDEQYGINCGYLDFPPDAAKKEKGPRCILTWEDELFKDIRNLYFSTVFPLLSLKAKELKSAMERQNSLSLEDLKKFIATELRGLHHQQKSLSLLIAASEDITKERKDLGFEEFLETEHSILMGNSFKDNVNFIENAMAQQVHVAMSLSLIGLLSLCQNGLPTKEYRSLKSQFLQTYGHKYLPVFFKLKKLKILLERESVSTGLLSNIAGNAANAVSPRMSAASPAGPTGSFQVPQGNSFPFLMKLPKVYGRSKRKKQLVDCCEVLRTVYQPPFWCYLGSLQTVLRSLIKTSPKLPFKREIIEFPDGGVAALDWLDKDRSEDKPIMLILPGLTGSTFESYCLHLAQAVSERLNYTVGVLNCRGNGGVELTNAHTYSAAYTDDLEFVVKQIKEKYPRNKLVAAGFSMGGMILFNYLSKCGKEVDSGISAAMIISSPFDPFQSTKALETFWPKLIFNKRLARCLVAGLERHRQVFDGHMDVDFALKSTLIREFDERFIVPIFKYEKLEDYYHEAALYYKIDRIGVPTLCLNAADDCFAPLETIPIDNIQQTDNVMAVITSHGGHVAFLPDKIWPSGPGFIEELAVEYFHHDTLEQLSR